MSGAVAGMRRRFATAGTIAMVLVAAWPGAADAAAARIAVPVNRPIVDTVAEGITDEALLTAVASIITAKLGLPLPSPLYAYFYESAEAFEAGLVRDAGGNPSMAKDQVRFAIGVGSARGIFLRRDRLVITTFAGRTGLYAHELAHVAQAVLAGGRRVPSEQWLDEGHADWVKYQVLDQLGLQPYERSKARMIRELRFGAVATLPALTTLSSSREWVDTRNRLGRRDTYVQAFHATDWLIERSGEEAMREYFRGERTSDRVTTFQSAFGINLADFSGQFADYLARLVRRPQ